MASESTEGRGLSASLPPALEEWLSQRAADTGVEPDELLVSLVAAYRDVTDGEGPNVEAVDRRVTQLLDRRLEQFDEDVERKLDDVRRRVVQLKKVTDERAAADRVAALEEEVEALRASVEETDERLAALDDVDTETLVAHDESIERLQDSVRARAETAVKLDERLEEVEEKLTRVARVVVALRRESDARGEGADEAQPVPSLAAAADDVLVDIKRTAAREGVSSADCGACGESVDLALLPEAACPHCGAGFGGLAGNDGVFSSPRLVGEGGGADDE